MRFKILIILLLVCLYFPVLAQLKVSPDHRFLQTTSGKPFFWLGDTAWELFHKLNREEADLYLKNRAEKGFTVIQAVILAELDGLNKPNPYDARPLIDNDPAKPNEAYFKHVDYIVKKAEQLGLIIAMLPSWGDKWNKAWGQGPEIFSPQNAEIFGEYLGKRYKNNAIIWVMGGDRDIADQIDREIITAMATGLKKGDGGKHLITFHPQGGRSSSDFFKDDSWMDFNMSQTGHSKESKNYRFNTKHLNIKPLRPHLDGEPRYEDHPNDFNPGEKGWMDDFDARQTAYWSLLSGACGHTYGDHNIWQMFNGSNPISWARTHWKVALDQPGAMQVGLMKRLFERYNWQRLTPDQSVIAKDNPETLEYEVAAVSQDGDFLMAYLPYGRKTVLNTKKLKAPKLKASLFNPRDGRSTDLGLFDNIGTKAIAPTSEGRGSDWVVIIEQQN
ncbi:MAG TPA: glycoside hydrolase family 140 protein [Pedobacter sp.]|nr:glycoside hydrolase family 140 protein [Pedobacter sp.]